MVMSVTNPSGVLQDSLSYHLDASNSCVTETDSEQTLIFGPHQHDESKRMKALDPFAFTSRAGDHQHCSTTMHDVEAKCSKAQSGLKSALTDRMSH